MIQAFSRVYKSFVGGRNEFAYVREQNFPQKGLGGPTKLSLESQRNPEQDALKVTTVAGGKMGATF